MKITFAAAALVAATGALAASNGTAPVYVTEVVTAFTTFCPAATTIVHGSSTYTVTEATTLTISDCPCTITKPASSAPVAATSAPAPYPVVNGTASVASAAGTAAGTGSATGSAPTPFTGAAGALSVPAGLAAIIGLAAYAL